MKSSNPGKGDHYIPPHVPDLNVVNPAMVKAKKRWTPTFEAVLCQLIPQDRTQSGIVMPQRLRMGEGVATPIARVIAVGPKCTQIKEGDAIILGNQPSLIINYGGEPDLILVPCESNVCGVIDPDDDFLAKITSDNYQKEVAK